MANTLFFDFDGTIADSELGIVNGIKYMVDKMHLSELTAAQYRDWIGPSLAYSMHKYFPGMDVQRGIKTYQEYYEEQGIFELTIYDGIEETLQALRQQGYQIAVASSKPEHMIERIIDRTNLRPLFDGAFGASADEQTRNTKTAVLQYALNEMHAVTTSSLMIGDRFTDIEGGQHNAVRTLGVTYGFGDYAELEEAGANMIVTTPREITTAVSQLFE